MRLLVDVNAAVALILAPYESHVPMAKLMRSVASGQAEAVYPAASVNELYYVLMHNARKDLRLADPDARRAIEAFCGLVKLADVTAPVVHEALSSDEPDYEDAVVRAVAERCACDAIVTSDRKAFANSFVKSLTPAQAAEQVEKGA